MGLNGVSNNGVVGYSAVDVNYAAITVGSSSVPFGGLEFSFNSFLARRDSAEHFSRLNALLFTATDWIFIPAHCFAIP